MKIDGDNYQVVLGDGSITWLIDKDGNVMLEGGHLTLDGDNLIRIGKTGRTMTYTHKSVD